MTLVPVIRLLSAQGMSPAFGPLTVTLQRDFATPKGWRKQADKPLLQCGPVLLAAEDLHKREGPCEWFIPMRSQS